MKGAIGLIRLAFRSLRYWRNRLFARHGGLQVAAPVRGTGTKRQNGRFRRWQLILAACYWPISSATAAD
jgi:hypothetical protein